MRVNESDRWRVRAGASWMTRPGTLSTRASAPTPSESSHGCVSSSPTPPSRWCVVTEAQLRQMARFFVWALCATVVGGLAAWAILLAVGVTADPAWPFAAAFFAVVLLFRPRGAGSGGAS